MEHHGLRTKANCSQQPVNLVTGILVNCRSSAGVVTRIARYPRHNKAGKVSIHEDGKDQLVRVFSVHTEKYFLNLVKSTRNQIVFTLFRLIWSQSTRNQIVFTIFRLIWNQTDVRLDPNQSEKGKYNLKNSK